MPSNSLDRFDRAILQHLQHDAGMSAAEVGEAVRLRAVLDYLTCDEVCIPYSTSLALDLPAGPAGPTEFTHLIDRYVARVPGSGEGQGLEEEFHRDWTRVSGRRVDEPR